MEKQFECLLIEKSNGVATITLNRPDVFNAFNDTISYEMQEALKLMDRAKEVRVVVLTGAGKAFCSGQDLKAIKEVAGKRDLSESLHKRYNPIIRAMRALPKPIICRLNGVAAGAGCSIALACDLVIAKESASFIQAFSKIGLIPDSGGTFILPRLIGMQKALALMITGDKVSAKDAEQMNMIYKAVSDENFDNEVQKISQTLAQMPTKGIGLTKRAINESWNNSLNQQLDLEEILQTEAGETFDFKEGVAAFLEKRKPIFKGK